MSKRMDLHFSEAHFDRKHSIIVTHRRECLLGANRKTILVRRAREKSFHLLDTPTISRPSQKSPIPLNRYDDFVDDLSQRSRSQDQTPEPRLVARALYNFVGQSSRELTFRRGDLIFVRRQVDKNWYEGEYNAMIGLFPSNYVEVIVNRV